MVCGTTGADGCVVRAVHDVGVGPEDQLAFLAKEGCEIQGYLIGRPQPIACYQHLVTNFAAIAKNVAIGG